MIEVKKIAKEQKIQNEKEKVANSEGKIEKLVLERFYK